MQGLDFKIFRMPERSETARADNGTNTTTTRTTSTSMEPSVPATKSPKEVSILRQLLYSGDPKNIQWISIDDMKDKLNRANHAVSKITVRTTTTMNPNEHWNLMEDWLPDFPTIAPTTKPIVKPATTVMPPMTSSLGTRTFIPALVSFVALLSLVMIFISVCKLFVHQSRKKRKRSENMIEDGSKLTTLLEPTAPPQDDHSVRNIHIAASVPASDSCVPPPDYDMLFGSAAGEDVGVVNPVTDINSRYQSENENLMPLKPLLDCAQTVPERENCGHSTVLGTTTQL